MEHREHPQAAYNGPGGYGIPGSPFRSGLDALPDRYYVETAKRCAGIFNKGATTNPAYRQTARGVSITASDGQITLSYGTSSIPVRLDDLEEFINDVRMVAGVAQAEESQEYRPGAGMTAPAGSDPMANDASRAWPALQAGGGNNARPLGDDAKGGNSGGNGAGDAGVNNWLSWLRTGFRPPIQRDDMGGMGM